jgi:hypothetical protein
MVERRIDERVQSFAVEVYSEEELASFRDLAADYREYRRKLRITPGDPYLLDEARKLKTEILHSFGPEGEQIAADDNTVDLSGGNTGVGRLLRSAAATAATATAAAQKKTPMKL